MAVFLIFATQKVVFAVFLYSMKYAHLNGNAKDILLSVCFWRKPTHRRPSTLLSHTSGSNHPLVPVLKRNQNRSSGGDTLDGDRSSKNTLSSSVLTRDYYELKASHGVEIIGKPDEAFRTPGANINSGRSTPKTVRGKKRRDTISTWGF